MARSSRSLIASVTLALLAAAPIASAQQINRSTMPSSELLPPVWPTPTQAQLEAIHPRHERPAIGTLAFADPASLGTLLAGAPAEFTGPGLPFTIPMPDGSVLPCEVWSAPVMHPHLAAKFPTIRTYTLSAPGVTGRCELTSFGLTALVRIAPELVGPDAEGRGSGSFQIDPVGPGGVVVSRHTADLGASAWVCEHAHHNPAQDDVAPPHHRSGYSSRAVVNRRTFRLAVASPGEFTVFHSDREGLPPNVGSAMNAIVIMVARANVVFESDMAVHFDLVANNDQLVFLNPLTDPYDGESTNFNLSANINTVNSIIGTANYEIGHVLTRIPGGVAYLGAVCRNYRAGGVSGIPRTDSSDPLNSEVLMHEIGHQFGGNHTFNGTVDRCTAGNRSAGSAWEPGSGSTILGYPGNCPVGNSPPGDNLQTSRDIMFHSGNIDEMRAFVSSIPTCGTTQPTTNNTPEITGLPPVSGVTLPRENPFELIGAAVDPDGNTLLVSWEELDLGAAQPLTDPDNGSSPIFRVFAPRLAMERLLPTREGIVTGVLERGEKYASVGNVVRRFRMIVRDYAPGAGGVTISEPVILGISNNSGPVRVLSPEPGARVRPGNATITWDPANTAAAPVSTASFHVTLSLDGGRTFPIILTAFAANTGSVGVTLPIVTTDEAVIRMQAHGNLYSAWSGAFRIASCHPDYNMDGGADTSDVLDLANDIASGTTSFPPSVPDFNNDGGADTTDVVDLADVVAGSGCP